MTRRILPCDLRTPGPLTHEYLRKNPPERMKNKDVLAEYEDWNDFGSELNLEKQKLTGGSGLNPYEKISVGSAAVGVLSLAFDAFLLAGGGTALSIMSLYGIKNRRHADKLVRELAERYHDATRRNVAIIQEVVLRFRAFVRTAATEITR